MAVLIKYFKFEGVIHYACTQLPPPPSIQGGEFDTLFIYIIQIILLKGIFQPFELGDETSLIRSDVKK